MPTKRHEKCTLCGALTDVDDRNDAGKCRVCAPLPAPAPEPEERTF